ncbi:hypothetical protein ACJX0J_034387, partial [Zea mays]
MVHALATIDCTNSKCVLCDEWFNMFTHIFFLCTLGGVDFSNINHLEQSDSFDWAKKFLISNQLWLILKTAQGLGKNALIALMALWTYVACSFGLFGKRHSLKILNPLMIPIFFVFGPSFGASGGLITIWKGAHFDAE